MSSAQPDELHDMEHGHKKQERDTLRHTASTPSSARGATEERDVLQLSSHAEVLADERHHDETHHVDRPPFPRGRPAIVPGAAWPGSTGERASVRLERAQAAQKKANGAVRGQHTARRSIGEESGPSWQSRGTSWRARR